MKHSNIHPKQDMVIEAEDHKGEKLTVNLFGGQCGSLLERKSSGKAEASFEVDGQDVWLTMPKGTYFTSNEGGIPDGY